MRGNGPVPNDNLVHVEAARAVQPYDGCAGCRRVLDKGEKFVFVLFATSGVKLCRYCVLKIHRISSQTDF